MIRCPRATWLYIHNQCCSEIREATVILYLIGSSVVTHSLAHRRATIYLGICQGVPVKLNVDPIYHQETLPEDQSNLPTMPNKSFTLDTEHGLISITSNTPTTSKPTLLLLHGNSSSSKIFRPIQQSESTSSDWHILTFDLPGHGASSNAPDPKQSYTMRGYASLALTILTHLNISDVVVLGWSLGGHIGIELLALLRDQESIRMKGLMLIGTPPALGEEQTGQGFTSTDPHLGLAAQRDWNVDEAKEFARMSAGAPFEPWMEACAIRTHGRAREIMWEDFADRSAGGVDQVAVVETSTDVLIAVVNGGDEPFINLGYLDEIKWGNLWKGECVKLKGLKHAPFWEAPGIFEDVLKNFLGDCVHENKQVERFRD
ncbi:unnamed protein product [Periconia digitata]|uniref:AB hydrolase-1 domain-containing protein n=1 Tax=Periconia digitata TaxID=1303443 RepID=A0A9W4XGA4_9PLEO|nr:unnamed protein product [Periconia digitata]